jgi:FkbM family methyltransferase
LLDRVPGLARPRGTLIPIKLPAVGRTVHIRYGTSDVPTLRQVFTSREYDIERMPQMALLMEHYQRLVQDRLKPVIVDGGANIGLSALWFASLFPEATVIAVEPEAANFEVLTRNLAGLPNVKPVRAALMDVAGSVRIANPEADAWAFQVAETAEGEGDSIPGVTVPGLTGSVPGGHLFLVKVDIEGAETALFRSNTDWVTAAAAVIVELHDRFFPGEGRARRVLDRLIRDDVDIVDRGENLFFIKNQRVDPTELGTQPLELGQGSRRFSSSI